MSLNLRIVEAIDLHDASDFEGAALRRRFLALLQGPVRHVDLSCALAAKILKVDAAALAEQLDRLVERGRLRTRDLRDGQGRRALYSLPSAPLPSLPAVAGPVAPPRSRAAKPSAAAERQRNKQQAAWDARLASVVAFVASREQSCAADVCPAVKLSQSTVWQLLNTAEHQGLVTSWLEPVPGKNHRRYYRVTKPSEEA